MTEIAILVCFVIAVLLFFSPLLIWGRQKAMRREQAQQLEVMRNNTEVYLQEILKELQKANELLARAVSPGSGEGPGRDEA